MPLDIKNIYRNTTNKHQDSNLLIEHFYQTLDPITMNQASSSQPMLQQAQLLTKHASSAPQKIKFKVKIVTFIQNLRYFV